MITALPSISLNGLVSSERQRVEGEWLFNFYLRVRTVSSRNVAVYTTYGNAIKIPL